LPAGGFTGVVVADARASLDALLGEPTGVLVTSIVGTRPAPRPASPRATCCSEVRGRETTPLHWPSEWRASSSRPSRERAARRVRSRRGELEADIAVVKRVQVAPREAAERFARRPASASCCAPRPKSRARAAGARAAERGGRRLTAESPWRKHVV